MIIYKCGENRLKLDLFYPTTSIWAWKSSKAWMRNVLLEEITLIRLSAFLTLTVYFCLRPSCYLWWRLASWFLCCKAEAGRNECWTNATEWNLMLVHTSHRNWHLHRQRESAIPGDFSRSECSRCFGWDVWFGFLLVFNMQMEWKSYRTVTD